MKLSGVVFSPSSKNKKKNHPKKISYTPGKWNFLTLILKKFLYFSKETYLYMSGNRNPPKISYFSWNGTFLYFRKRKPWKFLIFQEVTFQAWKRKKKLLLKSFLYFRKWTFLASRLKTLLYFRREHEKPENQTKKPAQSNLLWCFFNLYKSKA